MRQWAMGTFDSLNPFPVQGNPVAAVMLIYDQLMVGSPDEPSTEYGLIAEWELIPTISHRSLSNCATARVFMTASRSRRKTSSSHWSYQESVASPCVLLQECYQGRENWRRQVEFVFDIKGNRELPMIVGELPVLPKHFWEGTASNGEPRDFSKSTLEVPFGSGPYA